MVIRGLKEYENESNEPIIITQMPPAPDVEVEAHAAQDEVEYTAVLVLYGQDETRRTDTVKRINDLNGPIVAIEGNTESINGSLGANHSRNLFIRYAWEEFKPLTLSHSTEPLEYLDDLPVYHVVLRSDISILHDQCKIWETQESLFYFDRCFRELALQLGLPLLNVSILTLDQVIERLIDLVLYNMHWYHQCRGLRSDRLTKDMLEERDIETYLAHNVSDLVDDQKTVDLILEEAEQFDMFKDYSWQRIVARWYLITNLCPDPSNANMIDLTAQVHQLQAAPSTHMDESPFLLMISKENHKKVYQVITTNPYLRGMTIHY